MKKFSVVALGLFMSFAFATSSFACGDEAAAKKCGDKAKTCCASKKDAKSAHSCSGKDHKKAATSDATKKEAGSNKDAKKASN